VVGGPDEQGGRDCPPAGERPARGPYRNGRRTREQIIATAMTAFSQRGFHGSSTRQIAAAVGISPAAIQRHFDSKDDLLAAVLETWAAQTEDAQGLARLESLERWASLHQVMEYHVQHRGLLQFFIMLVSEATDPDHPARAYMAPRYQRNAGEFATALLQAADESLIAPLTEAAARREARALWAFMDGIEIQWLLDPELDMVAEFDAYLEHVFARLGAAGPPEAFRAPAQPRNRP
jgi:AcrR family transcriptional regulator